MAKNIFEATEVIQSQDLQVLEAPIFGFAQQPGANNTIDTLVGASKTINTTRTIDTEGFHQSWETERDKILQEAQKQADKMLEEAKKEAEALVESARQEAQSMGDELEKRKKEIENETEHRKEEMLAQAQEEVGRIQQESHELGLKEGKDEGYKEGYAEVTRLIQRLHTIIDKTLEKRKNILDSLEGQVIELAILVVRRVVKVLSENQKSVVINNIMQALQHLKSRSDIVVRVNLADLEVASEYTEQFIKQMEGDGKLTLAEDSSVEPGGCIIETDFGELDARISSQLNEIESRIRDLLPVSVRPNVLSDSTKL